MHGFEVEWLGTVGYAEALEIQRLAVEARIRSEACDRLFLLEHPPVVTLGSSARIENLLVSEAELAVRGIDLHRVRRGGDVTFHAPGQLVGYLVVDLAARRACDVHAFLRGIEGALLEALAALGVPGRRVAGLTGVFVADPGAASADRKIASIGIGVRRWVTYHGFALNVGIDLRGFDVIVPCGLDAVEMTSVARELRVDAEALEELALRVRSTVAECFARKFSDPPAAAERSSPDAAPLAPPLAPFGLRLHHDGRFTHEGQLISNRKLRERFERSVRYLADEDKYVVQIGRFRGEIEIEEAGFFVRSFDPTSGAVTLSDGEAEALDVASLRVSPIDGALLCTVKRDVAPGGLAARFRHAAHAELLHALADDGTALIIGSGRIALPNLEPGG